MNVLKKINLFRELSRPYQYFYLMPDGLYSENSSRLKHSSVLVPKLLPVFSIGDTLFLETMRTEELWKYVFNFSITDFFHLAENIFLSEKKIFIIEEIVLEDVVDIILQFKEKKNKNIYEQFLEFMIIVVFLESLKNSKIMIGGVWQGRSMKGTEGKSGYESFVDNLDKKNSLVNLIKPLLAEYSCYSIEEIGQFQIFKYRPYLSDYARYLEYIYLHVVLKNTIQKLYLMLGYANEQEKSNLRNNILKLKALIRQYETHQHN